MMKGVFKGELDLIVKRAIEADDFDESVQHFAKAYELFSQEADRLKAKSAGIQEELNSTRFEMSTLKDALYEKSEKISILSHFMDELFTNLSQGILFINFKGVILSVNESLGSILNLNDKALILKNFFSYFPDDFFGFSMKDALQFGITQKKSFIQCEKKEIQIESKLLLKGPKNYQGLLLILTDLTKLSSMNEKISHLERLKELGQMTSSIAHEIRNPLGGLRGYAMLLEKELQSHPQLKEMATHIKEGTKTLDRLLSKILTYAKPLEVKAKSSDLSLFMRNLIRFVKVDPKWPKLIKIDLHISEEPLYVPIDEDLFKQALLNLIINARQAMKDEGKLLISLMKTGNTCVINLSDTGKGMDEKHIARIFTPFFTTKEKGHGLGLTETHKIITAHYGKIEVRSEINRGTTFTITLPIMRS